MATKRPKEIGISASKHTVSGVSPHPTRTKDPVFPHLQKKPQRGRTKWPHGWIFGWAQSMATAFQYAGDKFWSMTESLRRIEKAKLEQDKLALGRKTLEQISWQSPFPRHVVQHLLAQGLVFTPGERPGTFVSYTLDPNDDVRASLPSDTPPRLSDDFVSIFVDAVRSRPFPKGREAQAKFLGESLAAGGEVGPRRSRDICGEERAKVKRATHQPEIQIKCCGKKRWTVGRLCPECGRSPFEGAPAPLLAVPF